ncbi:MULTISPECIES: gamma-glutamylcyclotransferase family protein [unclassified Coleofasciculus]|uniref:gamma-glutamylcyclotransferase family protein n=1 Tax=unclassified Coleofasciculus TaxID=2692782 RepID=UPI001881F4AF|nr:MULTISPECIES: gamma-glutamylcyclotransferase [unclassified Coleofasciculus]MBE9127713.1 gamma-glutamylcyclotransferase [Coleofasciculus sp. LEGE 07081]MBE9149697.1 gamma-glutamylcyclotransferase [Coleofasciculus sp. LEGE 07092]
MNHEPLKVFVYGTLKPGEISYNRYCVGKVVEEIRAIAFGKLFDLPVGYPAMTPGDIAVSGFLLTFTDPAILGVLDELEGYNPNRTLDKNEYYRQKVQIYNLARQSLGWAWVYLMNCERVNRLGGIPIQSGCWSQKLGI